MDNSLKPIEHFVQQGLSQRFQQVFGCPLVFSQSPSKKADAAKLMQDYNVRYPFAFATVRSDSITQTTYRPHGLWRRGLVGGMSRDATVAFRLNLIPVTTQFEITVMTDSSESMRRMSKTWLMAAINKGLKYSVMYGVTTLDINVELDMEFNIPTREGGLTEEKEYVATANIFVQGYMSPDELKKTQVVNAIEAVAYLGDPHDIALLKPDNVSEHVAFYFYTDEPPPTPPPAPYTIDGLTVEGELVTVNLND